MGGLGLLVFGVWAPWQGRGTGGAAAEAVEAGAEGPCAVTRVVDGDTVDVVCPAFRERVRLLRIDTPERGQPGSSEAADALAALIAGRNVYLVYETPGEPARGGYGRLLAYLVADGRNLNVEMVRRGHSPFWTRYGEGRFAPAFRQAASEAASRSPRD